MIEFVDKRRVYYGDTDAYGIVWHGAYVKWLEIGRTELVEKLGLSLRSLEERGITFPVVNINIDYKNSAKLNDILIIRTRLGRVSSLKVEFLHTIYNEDNREIIRAETTIVSIDQNGKLFRRMPKEIYNYFLPKVEGDK